MSLRACAALLGAVTVLTLSSGCKEGILGRQYEYEEDLVLALDGSATLSVNASMAALVALRGLDLSPAQRIDRAVRDRIRAAYECPATRVTRSTPPWRRAGRQFVQIRMDVTDIRKLDACAPLSWSRYELTREDGDHVFHQRVGASALKRGTLQNVGWNGSEIVGFRVHLPSKVIWHNSRDLETNETKSIARGNILGWEQHLADRLDGAPLEMEVRMESQSILYRTLWLFAGAFTAAIAVLAILIWLTIRKGRDEAATTTGP